MRRYPALLPVFLFLLITASCATIRHAEDFYYIDRSREPDSTITATDGAVLRVMTLNLAHGRGTGLHQLFATGRSIRANLDEVAAVVRREEPDILALQEADGESGWSGGFNHVAYLLKRTGLITSWQGFHVQMLGQQYGTALIAGRSLGDRVTHAFNDSSLVPPRGFVAASITWPGRPERTVDVVSVHLDFLSGDSRRQQTGELVKILGRRDRPLILMGDLNTGWDGDDGVLALLVKSLELRAWKPHSEQPATFPRSGRRVDWILVSEEFEFIDHRVLEDRLSDHRAVIADIGLAETGR